MPPKEQDWRIIVVRLNPPDNSVVDATIFPKKLCAHRRMIKKRSFSPLLFKRASDSPRDKLVRTCSCRFKPNVEKLSSLLLKNVSLFCEFFHTKFFLSFSSCRRLRLRFSFYFLVSFWAKAADCRLARKKPNANCTLSKISLNSRLTQAVYLLTPSSSREEDTHRASVLASTTKSE